MRSKTDGEDILSAFKAGLRGDPAPLRRQQRLDRRIATLRRILAEADVEWQAALLREPFTGRSDEDPDAQYEGMLVHESQFLKNGDPIALMRCFVMAVELGEKPPTSILDALTKAFRKVLKGRGNVKLDTVLGLKARKKGGRHAYSREQNYEVHYWLAAVMFGLIEGFGLTAMEAAERLSYFLERNPKLGKRYKEESLVQQYTRDWKKRFFTSVTPAHPEHPSNWPADFKERFFRRFRPS